MADDDILRRLWRYKGDLEQGPDEEKLLEILGKLKRLKVSIAALQETSIGKLVNSYRKYVGLVGSLARTVVASWKCLVTEEVKQQAVSKHRSPSQSPVESEDEKEDNNAEECSESNSWNSFQEEDNQHQDNEDDGNGGHHRQLSLDRNRSDRKRKLPSSESEKDEMSCHSPKESRNEKDISSKFYKSIKVKTEPDDAYKSSKVQKYRKDSQNCDSGEKDMPIKKSSHHNSEHHSTSKRDQNYKSSNHSATAKLKQHTSVNYRPERPHYSPSSLKEVGPSKPDDVPSTRQNSQQHPFSGDEDLTDSDKEYAVDNSGATNIEEYYHKVLAEPANDASSSEHPHEKDRGHKGKSKEGERNHSKLSSKERQETTEKETQKGEHYYDIKVSPKPKEHERHSKDSRHHRDHQHSRSSEHQSEPGSNKMVASSQNHEKQSPSWKAYEGHRSKNRSTGDHHFSTDRAKRREKESGSSHHRMIEKGDGQGEHREVDRKRKKHSISDSEDEEQEKRSRRDSSRGKGDMHSSLSPSQSCMVSSSFSSSAHRSPKSPSSSSSSSTRHHKRKSPCSSPLSSSSKSSKQSSRHGEKSTELDKHHGASSHSSSKHSSVHKISSVKVKKEKTDDDARYVGRASAMPSHSNGSRSYSAKKDEPNTSSQSRNSESLYSNIQVEVREQDESIEIEEELYSPTHPAISIKKEKVWKQEASQPRYSPTPLSSMARIKDERYSPTLVHSQKVKEERYLPTPISNSITSDRYSPTPVYNHGPSATSQRVKEERYSPTPISNNITSDRYSPTPVYNHGPSATSQRVKEERYSPTPIPNNITSHRYSPTPVYNHGPSATSAAKVKKEPPSPPSYIPTPTSESTIPEEDRYSPIPVSDKVKIKLDKYSPTPKSVSLQDKETKSAEPAASTSSSHNGTISPHIDQCDRSRSSSASRDRYSSSSSCKHSSKHKSEESSKKDAGTAQKSSSKSSESISYRSSESSAHSSHHKSRSQRPDHKLGSSKQSKISSTSSSSKEESGSSKSRSSSHHHYHSSSSHKDSFSSSERDRHSHIKDKPSEFTGHKHEKYVSSTSSKQDSRDRHSVGRSHDREKTSEANENNTSSVFRESSSSSDDCQERDAGKGKGAKYGDEKRSSSSSSKKTNNKFKNSFAETELDLFSDTIHIKAEPVSSTSSKQGSRDRHSVGRPLDREKTSEANEKNTSSSSVFRESPSSDDCQERDAGKGRGAKYGDEKRSSSSSSKKTNSKPKNSFEEAELDLFSDAIHIKAEPVSPVHRAVKSESKKSVPPKSQPQSKNSSPNPMKAEAHKYAICDDASMKATKMEEVESDLKIADMTAEKKKKKNTHELEDTSVDENQMSFEDFMMFDEASMIRKGKSALKSSKPSAPKASSSQSSSNKPSHSKSFSPSLESASSSLTTALYVPTPSKKIKLTEKDILSMLPETQAFYRPLRHNPLYRDEEDEGLPSPPKIDPDVIGTKTGGRTQVYSGRRHAVTEVKSLYDTCIQMLIDNIDAIDYVGGIPYSILRPVLERCTAQQLEQLEDYNPHFLEDSGELWENLCQREFRGSMPLDELESWRELYMRKFEERNVKYQKLKQSMSSSIAKCQSGRKAQLAFIDTVAKPPREVLRKQKQFGTGCVVNTKGNPDIKGSASGLRAYRPSLKVPVDDKPRILKPMPPMMAKSLQMRKNMRR